jgi:hypothetical protein
MMARALVDALKLAQKLLWELLVSHQKDEIDLKQWREHVDHAETLAADALRNSGDYDDH